jgi:hypothetical protein
LEVYRVDAKPAQIKRLKAAAATYGLLTSGGSDWHNPERNAPLGHFWVGSGKVQPLMRALGLDGQSAEA